MAEDKKGTEKKQSDLIKVKVKEELASIKDKLIESQQEVAKMIEEKIQNQDKNIDSLNKEFSKIVGDFEIKFNGSISGQTKILSEIESLGNKIKESESYVKCTIDSIRDENKKNGWKYLKLVSIFAGILLILLVFTSIFRPNKYRDGIDGIESNAVYKIKQYDSIFVKNVKNEINTEIYKYDTLNKLLDNDATLKLKEKLIARIEKRNDNYILENEKEKNQLIKNVTIINLIGRYTVIIFCIMAFVLVLRAFAGSKKKDDIFE